MYDSRPYSTKKWKKNHYNSGRDAGRFGCQENPEIHTKGISHNGCIVDDDRGLPIIQLITR